MATRFSEWSEVMGCRSSVFSEEQLLQYEELTFLTRAEILRAGKVFGALQRNCLDATSGERVAMTTVAREVDALKGNPFSVLICNIFCQQEEDGDGGGMMAFEDFLDMVSVFNNKCSKKVKIFWAFKIYDINGDGYICREDILAVLRLLTAGKMPTDLSRRIADKVLQKNAYVEKPLVTFNEFERSMYSSEDFYSNFSFSL